MTVYSAVVTTGIYCRPGCGARPLADNVRTFTLAATHLIAHGQARR
jgi:AraC family transcriptional regulator, regulatory protein of adaptative response / DNA-3-methyladenine glycosylase II